MGIPSFLLLGRVNVLAKTVDPLGYRDGRPICVLPVLYRAWTSVFCQSLLRQWSSRLPQGLFGGVPGRAARDVTYFLQHQIELSCLEDSPVSGFVLDIVKCFNAVPRAPTLALLCHLGTPRELATCWIEGLHRLGRSSSFVGDVSAPVYSTTGLPEGDGASVAAAVAIGWLFCRVISDFGMDPLVFVDNWAWLSVDPQLHAAGIAQTRHLADSLRLEIDWKKSFGWGRDKDSQQWWKTHGCELVPHGITLSVLPEAKDLGAAMRYRNSRALGSLRVRMEEGRSRLQKLSGQPRTLRGKAQIIQAAIWPAAFFGCEGHAVGLKHVHRLRGMAARTLIGSHQQLSPYLALSAIVPGLQDPEVYILVAALRALCRAMRNRFPYAQSILDTAHSATGDPVSVVGPGTALKALLVRNGWTLTGFCVTGYGNVKLDLRVATSRDVSRVVAKAWSFKVRLAVLHRNGLHDLGVPDPFATCVLQFFAAPDQRTIARHIVGAFQSTAVKSQWGGASSACCPWCGCPENKWHRFVECPAFAGLRSEHSDAVEVLRHCRPEWVHAPVATLPEVDDVLSLLFQSRPLPAGHKALVDVPAYQGCQGLTFYTDGTCLHPDAPCARHAAWALVRDVTSTDSERTAALYAWRSHGLPVPYFHVVDRGLVPGLQTIPRAELCAALQAIRFGRAAGQKPTHIVTDSAYVVHVVRQFQAKQHEQFLLKASNLDLLLQVQDAWFPGITVSKVKSHLSPDSARDDAHLWMILGNHCVDQACDAALRADLSVVHDMITEAAAFHKQQLSHLQVVYKYLLALHEATRLRRNDTNLASTEAEVGERPALTLDSPGIQVWLQARQGPGFDVVIPELAPKLFGYSSWGVPFTWRVWYWAHTVFWGEPRDSDFAETTTLELFCNFVVVTSSLPPHPVHTKGGVDYLDFRTAEARLTPTPLRTWLQALLAVVKQLERLSHLQLFPRTTSRKVTALQALGEIHPRSGYRSPCYFTQPSATAVLLTEVLHQAGTMPFRRFVQQHSDNLLPVPAALDALPRLSPAVRKSGRKRRQ